MTFLQPYPVVLKDWRYSKCILFEDDPKKSHFATSIWRAKRASHRQASQKSPKATYYECQNKCKWDILDDFQTTWESSFWHKNTNLSFFLQCNNCNNLVIHPDQRFSFFSDYSQIVSCPHCGVQEAHFAKNLPSIFMRRDERSMRVTRVNSA